MASASGSDSRVSGNTKTTAHYSVNTSGFGYSKITDDIKGDFDFLINDIPTKLDTCITELETANGYAAFNFEGSGGSEKDLSKVLDEIKLDVSNLKNELSTLHQAFMNDIDDINAELEYNFGWIMIGSVKGTERTEIIETESSSEGSNG